MRIHFLQLGPDALGLVDVAEVAKRGSQQGPRQVSIRHKPDTLAERSRCRYVFACDKVGQAKKVHVLLGESRIETHRLLEKRDRCQRIARIDFDKATRTVGRSVVWAEYHRLLRLLSRRSTCDGHSVSIAGKRRNS